MWFTGGKGGASCMVGSYVKLPQFCSSYVGSVRASVLLLFLTYFVAAQFSVDKPMYLKCLETDSQFF